MGRLTEYFGGGRNRSGDVIVQGADEVVAALGRIITKDAGMERELRKIIRKALQKARNTTSRDIHGNMPRDPRGTYKAVRHVVYKSVFGGSINILNKRKRGAPTSYVKSRLLEPGQRGGNRIRQSERTKQLESYGNSDRGFVLRFLNAGTDTRTSRFGNRGSISTRSIFARVAPWHMDAAASQVADNIQELIIDEMNG